MSKDVILKVENLSKQYRLGTVGTGTIGHDFNRFLARIRGKEDPYLKIGESNDRSSKGVSEYVWALKDINFEVKRGEVLGIIGKNGAGKSTLLKILSKVTGPTTGSIKSNGRIASLLEVGTGFHPEMTGKENIFLNGAILGMTKKEISDKLDEIVSFSGCERYIDTPVKRYSSGMKVRLAFAVAAHLEPDILIVDEVLAVGDAEFQKKAIGKMQDISGTNGRTVIFVSHNMEAVKSLCTRGIIFRNGEIDFVGDIESVLQNYLNNHDLLDSLIVFNKNTIRRGDRSILFNSLELKNRDLINSSEFSIGDDVNIEFSIKNNQLIKKSEVVFQIKNSFGLPIFHIMGRDSNFKLLHTKKEETFRITISDIRLFPGYYSLSIMSVPISAHQVYDSIDDAIFFKIIEENKLTDRKLPSSVGLFFINPLWVKI
jgi:ABC-type polysaccharide/polyol phosphate transport system ATPase subunit